ncbi:MAG TPA: hypothetical protein VFX61_21330 [Micromonosporaceae bacterium]|nr:hypothetical protein [Micromonosporaceae bacterium]
MTDDGALVSSIGEIRAKIDLLRRLDAEHGFGVVIEEQATPLEHIPELPPGVTEVFGIFRRLAGSYFCFVQPTEIGSRTAWLNRTLNPGCPMGNPLTVGYERSSVPVSATDVEGGDPIYLDVDDGGVYYIEPDDYIFLYENPAEDVEIEDFAADIATFFNEYVLGEKYPRLVEAVLGTEARNHRNREGEYTDSWMRLLVSGGLAS